jgi:hypothetical protein
MMVSRGSIDHGNRKGCTHISFTLLFFFFFLDKYHCSLQDCQIATEYLKMSIIYIMAA